MVEERAGADTNVDLAVPKFPWTALLTPNTIQQGAAHFADQA